MFLGMSPIGAAGELGSEVDKWKRFAQTISLIVEG
jgi:hypothetical protein